MVNRLSRNNREILEGQDYTDAAVVSIVLDGSRKPWHSGFTMRKHVIETGRYEPSTVNTLNQFHESFSPVQGKTALLYVSGTRQITEFRVSDAGFSILVWQSLPCMGGGHRVELVSYRPAEKGSNALWRTLEVDCLSGHARLTDRASVRGVGGNPRHREQYRATDDVATVVNWIRRAERWLDKRIAVQRKAILKANNAIAADEPVNDKIPYLPPSMEFELQNEAELNRDVCANILPQHLNVGSVKHWDQEGALIQRGKRVSGGSTTRALAGKRDRIVRLRDMARRQLEKAAECEREGSVIMADEYVAMSVDSEARASSIQAELNQRMAHVRAARHAKRAARLTSVTATGLAAQAVRDELTGVDRARTAAMKQADADE